MLGGVVRRTDARAGRLVFAVALGFGGLVGPHARARAEELPAQPAARPRVEIAMHGDPRTVESLRVQLEGAVGDDVVLAIAGVDRIDLAAAVAPGPVDSDTLARVWIELGDARATHATIVVVDGARERALVRHIRAAQGIDAAVRETVATICASAIEGLRAGAVIGLERAVVAAELASTEVPEPEPVEDEPPEVEVPPPRASGPSRAADASPPPRASPAAGRPIGAPIEIGWSLAAWSRAPAIQHGPTLGLGIVARGELQAGGGLAGQYRLPTTVDHEDVLVRIDSGALRVWGGVHPHVAPRLRLRARLGGGIDVLRAATRTRSPGVLPVGRAVQGIPIARASFGVQVALPQRLAVAIDLGVEVDLVDTEFVLRAPERSVFDPWRARPGLAIALLWDPIPGARGVP